MVKGLDVVPSLAHYVKSCCLDVHESPLNEITAVVHVWMCLCSSCCTPFLVHFPRNQVVVMLCFEDVVREKTKVKKAKKKTKRDKLSANAPDAVVKC